MPIATATRFGFRDLVNTVVALTDGDPTTFWTFDNPSGLSNHSWIQLDFGSPVSLRRLRFRKNLGGIGDFIVIGSANPATDGTDYLTADDVQSAVLRDAPPVPNGPAVNEFSTALGSGKYRYYRIVPAGTLGVSAGIQLQEIEADYAVRVTQGGFANGSTGPRSHTFFDGSTASPGVTVSNSNLTAAYDGTGASGNTGVRCFVDDVRVAGKLYVEFTADTVLSPGNVQSWGFCDAGSLFTTLASTGTHGLSIFKDGNVKCNGATIGSIGGTVASGDVIGCAIDFDLKQFFFKNVTTNTNWNNNSAADPVSGIGSKLFPASIWGVPLIPYVGFQQGSAAQATINVGDASFAGAVPAGYEAGWTPASASPGNIQNLADLDMATSWSPAASTFPAAAALSATPLTSANAGPFPFLEFDFADPVANAAIQIRGLAGAGESAATTPAIEHARWGTYSVSALPTSGAVGGGIVTDGPKRCIVVICITGRDNPTPKPQTVSEIIAGGLTFTRVVHDQSWGYTDPSVSGQVAANVIDVFVAPAVNQITSALSWSSVMVGDGFVSHGTVLQFAVSGLKDITKPFDALGQPMVTAFNTGTVSTPTTAGFSSSSASALIFSVFSSHPGAAVPTVSPGWTLFGTPVDSTGNASGHRTIAQYQASGPFTNATFPANFTDKWWLALTISFAGAPARPATGPLGPCHLIASNSPANGDQAKAFQAGDVDLLQLTQDQINAVPLLITGLKGGVKYRYWRLIFGNGAGPNGNPIYDVMFTQAPDARYINVDWDSIWSRGDRRNLIVIDWAGWTGGEISAPNAFIDNNYGFAAGNGTSFPTFGNPTNVGAFIGLDFQDFVEIHGFASSGGASPPGTWKFLGGIDKTFCPVITHGEDFPNFQIHPSSAGFPDGQQGFQITWSPIAGMAFPYYQFFWSVTGAIAGETFQTETWFSVAHSSLDGGDRRNLDGTTPNKFVQVTTSSGIKLAADSDPLTGVLDGQYYYDNRGGLSKAGGTRLQAAVGVPVTTPGEYFKFQFPRAVAMRQMVWNVDTAESGVGVLWGVWQWQGSDDNTTWADIGAPWSFRTGTHWMDAPSPIPAASTQIVQPYLFWRMVLTSGTLTNTGLVGQIIFNLQDFGDQAVATPSNDFSDGDADAITWSTAGFSPPGDPFSVALSDNIDDALSAIVTLTKNPLLRADFSDGTSDALSIVFDLQPSNVAQVTLVMTGR